VEQRDQLGHEIRADRVYRAEAQRSNKLVLALRREVLDRRRFLEHALRLLDDPRARGRHRDFGAPALKQRDAELVLELFHRDRQGGLAHEAFFRGAAEMALAREGDDVAKLCEGHLLPISYTACTGQ
jgi:hypothetical protein